MTENEPRIFLCHASDDKPRVRELYHQLKAVGYHPWLDEEDLLPGADWDLEIRQAIRSSEFFLACLSNASIDKRGYVQKEIKMGLDVLDEMPEGKIYLIPVRLEDSEVPDRLQSRQWVDLFTPDGFEKLKQALEHEIGKPRLSFEPELILIPAGEFLMGSDPKQDKDAYEDEQPQHTVHLRNYYISKTPTTNAQYAAFVRATAHEVPVHWMDGEPPIGKKDHPVVWVSWYDAKAFCIWLTDMTGKPYGLPSEAEWEKAARGTDGRIYPWGNKWDKAKSNTCESWLSSTTPVGRFSPDGDSPYGCVDMAGNVWEWTRCLWGKDYKQRDFRYPYDPLDGREDPTVVGLRALRGGSFTNDQKLVRCGALNRCDPVYKDDDVGFRTMAASSF